MRNRQTQQVAGETGRHNRWYEKQADTTGGRGNRQTQQVV